MVGALFLIAVGAGLGYAAWAYLRLDVSLPTAIGAGALGGLVFGTLIKLLLGLIASLVSAVLGAALLIWVASAWERRRRR